MNIKKLRFFLKLLMVASLFVFPLFLNLISGIALICNAQTNISGGLIEHSDFITYRNMGAIMVLSCIMMLFATIFIFRKKNILAVIIELTGLIMCLAVIFGLRRISIKNGLSNNSLIPYAHIYLKRHLPTVIHSLSVCILAITDHFTEQSSLTVKKGRNTNHS